ncbi:hypothetical protein WJX73_006443 [Symbiochloris irregularis]|uniref:Uncharacterized protein n=1 Tax=Symbiochloris irregularis TaxID=706552 RepID=A0AAW1PFU8_9CHLO
MGSDDSMSEKPVLVPGGHPEGVADPGKAAYAKPTNHVGFEWAGDGNVKTAERFTEETDTGTGMRHAINRFLWRGGSGYDAFLNSACSQIGQVRAAAVSCAAVTL